jgi:hypothetical protein
MNELIQELSRRRFMLGRETYRWFTHSGNEEILNELRPLEIRMTREEAIAIVTRMRFAKSLIEEEAPQIYPNHNI